MKLFRLNVKRYSPYERMGNFSHVRKSGELSGMCDGETRTLHYTVKLIRLIHAGSYESKDMSEICMSDLLLSTGLYIKHCWVRWVYKRRGVYIHLQHNIWLSWVFCSVYYTNWNGKGKSRLRIEMLPYNLYLLSPKKRQKQSIFGLLCNCRLLNLKKNKMSVWNRNQKSMNWNDRGTEIQLATTFVVMSHIFVIPSNRKINTICLQMLEKSNCNINWVGK